MHRSNRLLRAGSDLAASCSGGSSVTCHPQTNSNPKQGMLPLIASPLLSIGRPVIHALIGIVMGRLLAWLIWLTATAALLPLAWDAGRLAGANLQTIGPEPTRSGHPDQYYQDGQWRQCADFGTLIITTFLSPHQLADWEAPQADICSLGYVALWPVHLGTRFRPRDVAEHLTVLWFVWITTLEVVLACGYVVCTQGRLCLAPPCTAHMLVLQLAVVHGMAEAGVPKVSFCSPIIGVIVLCLWTARARAPKRQRPEDLEAVANLLVCADRLAIFIQVRWWMLPLCSLLVSTGWAAQETMAFAHDMSVFLLTTPPVYVMLGVWLWKVGWQIFHPLRVLVPALGRLQEPNLRPLLQALQRNMATRAATH